MSLPDYGIIYPNSTAVNILRADEYAEKFILSKVDDLDENHQVSQAQLWVINKDSTFKLLAQDHDIYDLLDQTHDLSSYVGIVVFTTGWAAPLNSEGSVDVAPSKHSMRRRIALAACVTTNSFGSAISFADNKEVVLDPGSASGSLAEALSTFWLANS